MVSESCSLLHCFVSSSTHHCGCRYSDAHTSQLKCSAAAASPAAVLVMVVAHMISLLCQLAY